MSQKLTPTARRMKAIRDKRYAMTEDRKKKKAENQRKRRAALKAGINITPLLLPFVLRNFSDSGLLLKKPRLSLKY